MANAGAIDTVLVPGCLALAPGIARNSGTYANKSGYHNSRNNLRTSSDPDWRNDYSIQLAIDKEGPGDKGSAFDLSFDDARLHGDYKTINKFSRLLYEAGQRKDPRAYPLREFQGNIDSDTDVEGWSFYRGWAITTSDKTHLWHIHFSVHRRYIDDEAAMRSILSILNEEEDMAVSPEDLTAIAKAVWRQDNEIENIWTYSDDNKYAQAKNAIEEIGKDDRRIRKDLVLVKGDVAAIKGDVAAVETDVATIKSQVAQILELLQTPPTV